MTGSAYAVVGYPLDIDGRLYNVAGVLHRGAIIAQYRKQYLPNYQVFDEKRYFSAGNQPCVVNIEGVPVGLSICEDIWEEAPTMQAANAGARLLLNINSSPFHRGKRRVLCSKLKRTWPSLMNLPKAIQSAQKMQLIRLNPRQ